MLANTRRYLLIIALLLVGLGLTWGQRWSSAARFEAELPQPAGSNREPGAQAEEYTYFLDVEGWYRITPYETVVRSAYDLTGETTETVAAALPATLGQWHQVGPDEYIGDDPAVVFYLNQPAVAFQRTYENAGGQQLTLAMIGNKGEDSFLLFSHTPETCYPGRLWEVADSRRESALLDNSPMHAQYLLTQQSQTGQKLLTLFWYLWDNPQRDAQDGVLSIRVNLFVPPAQSEDEILSQAWDFVRALFPATIPWERF
jgi:hypothetical protein